jgi:hypothetical protein
MPPKSTPSFATCEHCGAQFLIKWSANPNRFCSRSCRSQHCIADRRLPEDIRRERRRAGDFNAHRAMYARRREWYQNFMQDRMCMRCGSEKRLQWHHRDPATKFMEVARMVPNFNRDRLLEEIAKCELLCRDCHTHAHRELRST